MTTYLHDPTRLQALTDSGLLDAGEDERLVRLCGTAGAILDCAAVEINVVSADRQVFVASWPYGPQPPVTLESSACRLVVVARQALSISDATEDPILCHFEPVKQQAFLAYLGVPLFFHGECIGSLCALDGKVREWGMFERNTLDGLARLAELSVERGPLAA